MKFLMLGNLEVIAGDGNGTCPLSLGAGSEQKVLAVLLLEAGRMVPVSELVDALWDADPPVTAAKQARNAVSRLRQLLSAGAAPPAVLTGAGGYKICVAQDSIDALVFDKIVQQAAQAAGADRVADAARLLESALGLWRGPFLAGMPGRAIESAAAVWDERRCAVTETYYDHQLALGRHRQIVGQLESFAHRFRLREKPVEQLMLALYRCGRQADALAVYRDTRSMLADELGIDPGHALQRLHQRILGGDRGLEAGGATGEREQIRARPAGPVPRQLPAGLRHFIGRLDELNALTSMLDEAAGAVVISAINGMAGVGKTALAVRWAHQVAARFPDGQLYADLRGFSQSGPVATAAEVIRGFLDALSVPAQRIPATVDAQAALYRSLLAGKRVLVVLDNVRDEAQVRPLLPGSPACLVIITSRRQLTGLTVTEQALSLTLDMLGPDEARALLARSLGRHRIADQAVAADDLIALCGRLPLALSITAARAAERPALPLAVLAGELRGARGRLDALATGDVHTDMRAVLSWSCEGLDPRAARMFRLLGMHPGPDITLAAAASLAGAPVAKAREAVIALLNGHLLTERVPGRFTMHDLLRAYAAEQAETREGRSARRAALRRMLDHYLHTGYAAALLLNPPTRHPITLAPAARGVRPEPIPDAARAWSWFESEVPVLVAVAALAAQNEFGAHAWQLPWTLALFCDRSGRWHEWASAQEVALAAVQRLGDLDGQAHAHLDLGYACIRLGRHADSECHLQRSLDLFCQLGDRLNQAHVHTAICVACETCGEHRRSLSHGQQALALYRAAGHKAGLATGLNSVGYSHGLLGEHETALVQCREAVDLHRQLGNRHGEASALDSLGYSYRHLGRGDEAVACYEDSLRLFRELGNRYYEAEVLDHLGEVYRELGDPDSAHSTWQQALALLEDLRHPDTEALRAKISQLPATAR
jgi:DNA-binding SARP family transcriptional activator/tetratricopeptide (TPR) repeat protein